ncbi:hypothetical protein FB446DRAFT_789419 [Lentinula raphanica]|nr:hypothetical protein FB446DRAFT_789419 [Lentinula raphanica]
MSVSIREDSLSTELARIRGKPVVQIKRVDDHKPTVLEIELQGGEQFIVRCENVLVFNPELEETTKVIRDRVLAHATILKTLREIYRIPVPTVYHVEPDAGVIGAPWMLLERIHGGKLHFVVSRWGQAVREGHVKLVVQQYASLYAHIFDTPIPETLSSVLSEENQHCHHDPMPAAFDIRLQYDPLESVDANILRARAYRQETVTFLAHRFWAYMHDGFSSAESLESDGWLPDLLPILHKLKVLVPVLIPSVEDYLKPNSSGQGSLLGTKKLYHYDPSVSNIIVDPESAKINGIVDWELTMAVPALLAAVYPEWIRYDGKMTPTSFWSSNLLQLSPEQFEYGKWRELFEDAIGKVSPDYLAALHAGQELRELLDWLRFAGFGRPIDQRMAALNDWITEKAKKYGADLTRVEILHKKDWL